MLNAQKISCLARIRPGEASSTYGTMGSVYLQVVIDRVPERIPLGIAWPVQYFDVQNQKLKERFENDEVCYQNNMLLNNELAKANRLRLELYVANINVCTKEFRNRLQTYASREDFIQYMIKKRTELMDDAKIAEGTAKKYWTNILRLQDFVKHKGSYGKSDQWKFNLLTPDHISKFELWLFKERGLSHNTICGAMRVLHKFFKCAAADGIAFNNPMADYKMAKFSDGIREALDLEEVGILKRYYLQGGFTDHETDVLERYLVSCFTGLRKSDIEQIDTRIHVANGRLRLKMFKTRKLDKSVEFKLPQFILAIIGKRRGRLYPEMESSLLNKTLRIVIKKINSQQAAKKLPMILKYVKFQSGRDTFATNFLRLGGMISVLKDLLGHSSIQMTEIYVKMASSDSDDTMDKFDGI